MFQSLWESARELGNGWLKVILPLGIAVLGLVGALALASMVKWFGSAFLGQPRTVQALRAREVHISQRMSLFIAVTLALGTVLWPGEILRFIFLPLSVLNGSGRIPVLIMTKLEPLQWFSRSSALYLIFFSLILSVIYLITRGSERRVSSSWNCGIELTPRMQYSSMGITMPIRTLFKLLLGSRLSVKKEFAGNRYVLRFLRYEAQIKAIFEDTLYRPSARTLLWLADKIRILQAGSIHLYLGYLLVTVVLVLIWQL